MGWSYSFWVGKLYLKGAKPKDYLYQYSRKFNSVEVDSTFYRIPSKATVEEWKSSVPNTFKFAVKMHQGFTHSRGLLFEDSKLDLFIERILILGKNLGPVLLQFPPWLSPKYEDSLIMLLDRIPETLSLAIEFRNKGWLTNSTFTLLRDNKIALVIVNKPSYPIESTANFYYLRWEGDRKQVNGEKGMVEIDKDDELTEWAVKVSALRKDDVDVYGYFSKYFSGYPPADIEGLTKRFSNNFRVD